MSCNILWSFGSSHIDYQNRHFGEQIIYKRGTVNLEVESLLLNNISLFFLTLGL